MHPFVNKFGFYRLSPFADNIMTQNLFAFKFVLRFPNDNVAIFAFLYN